jgi:GntR family transcriptional regulator
VAEKNPELLREENLRKIEEHLEEIRRLAVRCGLTREELNGMLAIIEEEDT